LFRNLHVKEDAYFKHQIYEYSDIVKRMLNRPKPEYTRFPCVTPSWDNSPRRKSDAVIMRNSSPEIYQDWLCHAICESKELNEGGLVFINAWNEWAEGNHLEPCQKWGLDYLKATQNALCIPSKA